MRTVIATSILLLTALAPAYADGVGGSKRPQYQLELTDGVGGSKRPQFADGVAGSKRPQVEIV